MSLSIPRTIALTLFLSSAVAGAQERYSTKTRRLPAPTRVTTDPGMRATPPPQAERNAREAALADHHRPGLPLAPPPPGAPRAVLADLIEVPVDSPTVSLTSNRPLSDVETNGITSQVGEPSIAVRGSEILFTGNWFASFSTDGGSSFSYVNPSTTFPEPPGQDFCCDQVALYDAAHDLMIWFLQYVNNATGNTGRIAVAHGADIPAQNWRIYDFTPQGVGGWTGEWFDFPDLAVSGNFLYVTTNLFTTSTDTFTRAVILRLPLQQLADYAALDLNFFESTNDFSLRPTQGAAGVMYFANHVSLSSLRVFTWDEANPSLTSRNVGVQAWSNATRSAPGPDNRDWLGRVDARITAAWRSGGRIGFAWTAAKDTDFPFAHVRVAILDAASNAVLSEPHIWSSTFAYAYPAAGVSSEGVVGVSLFYGGGPHHPSHAVGVLDSAADTWEIRSTFAGTHGPSSNRWGDYLAVRPHGADAKTFVATGFSQQGGPAGTDIVPRYIHFSAGGEFTLTLNDPDPGTRLGSGDSRVLTAVLQRGGAPAAGETVTFSSDSDVATVSPTSATTDASGQAQTTVTGQAMMSSEARITAKHGDTEASTPVLVPDLSTGGLVLLTLLAGLLRKFWR